MSQIRTANCPRCGAPMTIRDGQGQCEYCDYVVTEEAGESADGEKYSYEDRRHDAGHPFGADDPAGKYAYTDRENPADKYTYTDRENPAEKYAYTDHVQPAYSTGSPKSRTVALALCLFVGWLGVHRFYSGRIITGILYLLTFGVFGFGVLIDLILIILGKFKDGKKRLIINW